MYCYRVKNLKVGSGFELAFDEENTPCIWIGDKAVCLDTDMLRKNAEHLAECKETAQVPFIDAAQLQRRHFDSYWLTLSKGEEWLAVDDKWRALESPVLVHYTYECQDYPLRVELQGGAKKFDHLVHLSNLKKKASDSGLHSRVDALCRMAIGDGIDVYNDLSGRLVATLRYDGLNFFESHNPSRVSAVWVNATEEI